MSTLYRFCADLIEFNHFPVIIISMSHRCWQVRDDDQDDDEYYYSDDDQDDDDMTSGVEEVPLDDYDEAEDYEGGAASAGESIISGVISENTDVESMTGSMPNLCLRPPLNRDAVADFRAKISNVIRQTGNQAKSMLCPPQVRKQLSNVVPGTNQRLFTLEPPRTGGAPVNRGYTGPASHLRHFSQKQQQNRSQMNNNNNNINNQLNPSASQFNYPRATTCRDNNPVMNRGGSMPPPQLPPRNAFGTSAYNQNNNNNNNNINLLGADLPRPQPPQPPPVTRIIQRELTPVHKLVQQSLQSQLTGSCSATSRPVSALQAAYDRQKQNFNKCLASSARSPPTAPPAPANNPNLLSPYPSAAAPSAVRAKTPAMPQMGPIPTIVVTGPDDEPAAPTAAPPTPAPPPAPINNNLLAPVMPPRVRPLSSPAAPAIPPSSFNRPCTTHNFTTGYTPTPPPRASYCGPSAAPCAPQSSYAAREALLSMCCRDPRVEMDCCEELKRALGQEESCLTIDPSMMSASHSFYVPETLYGEVCIKTPCKVDIVAEQDPCDEFRPRQQRRKSSLVTCATHGTNGGRYNYTQYANVHDLNHCTAFSQFNNRGGVPKICGQCVPPPPKQTADCGNHHFNVQPQQQLIPKYSNIAMNQWHQQPPAEHPQMRKPSECRKCNTQPRTYEEIKKDCEKWAAERAEEAKKTAAEEVAKKAAEEKRLEECKKKAHQVAGGKQSEEVVVVGTAEGEKQGGGGMTGAMGEKATNFINIVKEFATAIGNVGAEKAGAEGGQSTAAPPPVILPEITVTRSTPVPQTPGTSGAAAANPSPLQSNSSMFVKSMEKLVADEEERKKRQQAAQASQAAPQVAQMFGWAMGGSQYGGVQNQYSQYHHQQQPGRTITPSDCGFCKSLADIRMGSYMGKRVDY